MRRLIGCIFTIFLLCTGLCCAPAHAACTSDQIDVLGDGAQCENTKFSVTTTNLSANTVFRFSLTAGGTFYIDCGDDGILSGNGVSGKTVIRSAGDLQYSCTYSTGGVKTISFGGVANSYATSYIVYSGAYSGALMFTNQGTMTYSTNTPTLVAALNGDLSSLFPYLGESGGQYPTYYALCFRCSNLTSVSGSLFSGYTVGKPYMFNNVLRSCTKLTSLPSDLFSNITSAGVHTFSMGFTDDTALSSIPAGFFSSVITAGERSFNAVFQGCTGLTSIPENLFSGVTNSYSYMFNQTFNNCSKLAGYIPPSAFAGLIAHGHPTASNMWYNTFNNTKLVTSCPSDTTQYITGYEGSGSSTWNGKVSCQSSTPTSATITYVMNGGTNYSDAPTTYTYVTGATIDGIPTKAGSMFVGWCTDSGLTSCAMTQTIGTDATGDKTFWAKWSECTACATTNASCSLSVVNNTCTYATACNTGYGNIQASGEYNASCTANIIELHWGNADDTYQTTQCTYGGSITTPTTPPMKRGHIFTGWVFTNS